MRVRAHEEWQRQPPIDDRRWHAMERRGQRALGKARERLTDEYRHLVLGEALFGVDPAQVLRVDAEEGLAEDEMTIFVGESLSRITKGALPAPLHRVPPPIVDGRLALPLFVRAHPHARLGATTAEEFVVEHLFRRRPWRPSPPNGTTPDF